jgi:regulator of RNase E activity RraA
VKSQFPERKPLVGYACTARISAAKPVAEHQKELIFTYYQSILDAPNPTISVIEDMDLRPYGSFWGEVNVNTHKALGCNGLITNGAVRDLDEVKELDFDYFAGCVLVSHGYVHVEEVDCPVSIAGLTIYPGDLLHADKHGVVLIPADIAPELADACRLTQEAEKPILDGVKNAAPGTVTVEDIKKWRGEMQALRSGKKG